jgi:hypothetical protein
LMTTSSANWRHFARRPMRRAAAASWGVKWLR